MCEKSEEKQILGDTGNGANPQGGSLLDATLLISILTAISYFFAYVYKKGFYSFYGLSDLTLDDIGTSDVMEVTELLVILISLSALIYFAYPVTLIISKVGSKFLIRSITFSAIGWLSFNEVTNIENINVWDWMILIFLTTFVLWLGKKTKPCLAKLFKYELRGGRDYWRGNQYINLIIGALLFGVLYFCMTQYGQVQAQKKNEYLLLEDMGGAKYVIIQQTKSYYVLSRLLSEDGDIARRYEVKEIKPNKEEQFIMLEAKFENGLIIDGRENKKRSLFITPLREYFGEKLMKWLL
ncbi:hypothetical protein P4646_23365 [Peribacillus simplex]|uniref:hypothetical protein n=1 Tax=Peribacillus simplex TaxID=1478 RepID=UPI002E1A3A7C|nr:hypothetical protein [Peribacillus simplex]MED4094240.1 hypothetical protein [Peribacillus simplex]